jgi:hypothetical protein
MLPGNHMLDMVCQFAVPLVKPAMPASLTSSPEQSPVPASIVIEESFSDDIGPSPSASIRACT